MGCPQCRSDEISSSGVCLVCGYQVPANAPAPESESGEKEGRSFSGMIEMNYSEGTQESSPKNEMPQWRKDLSERLLAIKQKREAAGAQGENKVEASAVSQITAAKPPDTPPAKIVERAHVRKPAPKPHAAAPLQKVLQPLEPESSAAKPALKTTDPQEIQRLIDNIVSRQSSTTNAPVPVAEAPVSAPDSFADHEGKLILLSRTLSGLVDLIVVVLGTGGFILAADFFSGIIALDSISLVNFSLLFLLTYFIYSIFFLATSGQTVGMMITDLRVVGVEDRRPSLRQLLSRCCSYLASLLGLGIGLLWSLFNQKSLCFQDRFSNTRVVRI